MNNITHTDKSALSLILYPYQFSTDISSLKWSEAELSRLERIYPLDKLIYIDQNIKHYFLSKDVDLDEVLPSTNKSRDEKERLLSFISEGIEMLSHRKKS